MSEQGCRCEDLPADFTVKGLSHARACPLYDELQDMSKPPSKRLPPGQVWVGMNGPDAPHWEPRGTGALLDETTETEAKT